MHFTDLEYSLLIFADLTLFVVVILLSVAHGAPHRQRYRRHHRYLSQVQLAHEPMPLRPMEWVNPCKIQAPQVSHLNTTQTGEPPYPPPKNVSLPPHFNCPVSTKLRMAQCPVSTKLRMGIFQQVSGE